MVGILKKAVNQRNKLKRLKRKLIKKSRRLKKRC